MAGTGGSPTVNSIVKVEYTGYLLNGEKFDGTDAGQPIEFGLNQVIQGWREGIPKYQKGGKGKLIIPSSWPMATNHKAAFPAIPFWYLMCIWWIGSN
ncbi:MAG: FKBP-type peptidyl-prolyl cis-trans isomerase [Bacteroidetes bacterium]|nr:FKBP-type peptidyl-prolyl cis-trans isomerase [Bacteroidota bacterium]